MLNLINNNLTSKKRKHSIDEVDEIEGDIKRSRCCTLNDNSSIEIEELFMSFSVIVGNSCLTSIGEQFETMMKGLPSPCSEQGRSDCYALLRDCFLAVKDLDNLDPLERLNSETSSRSSRPPVRDQSAYFVDKKFYFERV